MPFHCTRRRELAMFTYEHRAAHLARCAALKLSRAAMEKSLPDSRVEQQLGPDMDVCKTIQMP